MTEIIKITPGDLLALDPTASGFAHGFGLFETIQLSGGHVVFWEPHWARLKASAEALQLELTCSADAVLQVIRELAAADGLDSALIKLSLVRDAVGSRLFVYARPAQPVPAVVGLRFDPNCPINERSILAGHKTHNYMENISLLESARAADYYDVLRVNTIGELAETTIGNIFFVIDGALWTPALETGILPGVIRGEIIALHPATREARFEAEILERAEAVFMTNSSCGILPVESIAGEGFEKNYSSARHPLVLQLQRQLQAAGHFSL